jgi:tetratricopeptide (TPR) repeat protein
MSFDKTKFLRNAERFLAQGKVRAAIGEYKRIVENDPKDFSTLNILGDLYMKSSETSEAVKCYTAVAEHYGKQGFAQKAIAIYNKILRITPDAPEVSLKLAQFYQMKGSPAEARVHYSNLAEYYKRHGRKADALAVWKQIAELDPNNTEIYLKIAESCLQDDQAEEAVKAYVEAGTRFSARKQFEAALSAFAKALEIRPHNLAAVNGLVTSQIGLGFADDAAKTLENLLEKQPYNREILYLLVDCHLNSNNPVEAEKAVIKLVEQEPANYRKFLDVAQCFLKNDDLPSAARILSMTSEHLLVGGQAEELGKWINEILAKNPEQLDALRLLARYHGWQRDEGELKKSLERLVEAARHNDAVEDERSALSQLIMMAPQETEYARRLQEINEKHGFIEYASAMETVEPESNEIPTYDNFAVVETADGDAANENYLEDYAEFKPDAAFKNASFEYQATFESAPESGFAFEENGQYYDFSGEPMNTVSIADLQNSDNHFAGGDFAETIAEVEVEEVVEKPVIDPEKLREELETVEYYNAQGYTELALKTLDTLTEKFGEIAEVEEARSAILNAKDEVESVESVAEAANDFAVETPKNVNLLDDFRDELGFEEKETADQGDFETHYQLGIAYREMSLLEDAIRELQEAVKLVSATDGTKRFFHCCNLLGLCFMEKQMPNIALMWYRRCLETNILNEEELQGLRYEIANAYEAGGEPQRAVEFFEQIYAVNVEYRDVSERLSQLHAHH